MWVLNLCGRNPTRLVFVTWFDSVSGVLLGPVGVSLLYLTDRAITTLTTLLIADGKPPSLDVEYTLNNQMNCHDGSVTTYINLSKRGYWIATIGIIITVFLCFFRYFRKYTS